MGYIRDGYRRAKDTLKKNTSNVHPQRWVITLRPTCIERVPQGVKQVVLEWKGSGSKLSFTKVQPVNNAGMVVFDETLNMTTTLYRTETGFEPKPYTLRAVEVQEVKSMGRVFDKTRCIADYKSLDFAVFTRTCLEHAGAEEEIEVALKGSKGSGAMVLRAFVKASLLNDLKSYEGEAVSSELSFMSEERTPASALDEEYIDDDDSQELPCLGPGQGGSSMSTTSDDSEGMNSHMPSPGRKQPHSAREEKASHFKPASAAKQAPKAPPILPPAVSLDTGISRSHRTRDRDRVRERQHDRTKSVDWCLETITEADQRWSAPDEVPDADEVLDPASRRRSKEPQQALTGLPQRLSFLNNLLRNKPPASLKDLSPQELQIEAARRETVEIKGEQDLDTLREHAVNLVYARELLKAKNNELKQMLTESQTHVHSDETITQELVQAKLDLADSAYEKLKLQSAYDRIVNKNRSLSHRLTQAAVDRDLLAHRLARANGMDY